MSPLHVFMCSEVNNHNNGKDSQLQSMRAIKASRCLNKSLGSYNMDLWHVWFWLLQNVTALWCIRSMCMEGRSERSIHSHAHSQREAETGSWLPSLGQGEHRDRNRMVRMHRTHSHVRRAPVPGWMCHHSHCSGGFRISCHESGEQNITATSKGSLFTCWHSMYSCVPIDVTI